MGRYFTFFFKPRRPSIFSFNAFTAFAKLIGLVVD